MALYLVQHGKALSREQDPAQGLSEAGKEETVRIAGVAKGYHVQVGVIRHSGKTRAKETAEILADCLSPHQGVEAVSGLRPMDDPGTFSSGIRVDDDCMVVGHLPFLERLVTLLTTGKPGRKVFRFQNSGIVCLDLDDDGWFIKWALMPNIG